MRRGRRGATAARGQAAASLALWAGSLIALALLVPLIIVTAGHDNKPSTSAAGERAAPQAPNLAAPADAPPYVRVLLSGMRQVERVALEQYVRGVIAAEMPERFELEALKAQAIAARTYIVRRLMQGEASGGAPEGADVTDTVAHQAYVSLTELDARTDDAVAKLNRAVNETAGLIAAYDNQPIDALYFSTSNGFTENAEDYWSVKRPYLCSVASPWDEELSPRFNGTTRMDAAELLKKLGLSAASVPAFQSIDSSDSSSDQALASAIQLVSKTPGGRVAQIKVGENVFSGREIREKLELPSTDFTWSWDKGKIVFETRGYGHGVGMSQYGAQGMALAGAAAEQILTYYYQDVQIVPLASIVPDSAALARK
ncbi:stage II sporulation protein D [Paenibacillus marinisediminis]